MRRLATAFAFLFIFAIHLVAQSPRCTDTCIPSPTSTTYPTNAQSRPNLNNARGSSNIAAPQRSTSGAGSSNGTDLPGSQSYNYGVPILHLLGRNGLDVDLVLSYNSSVWTINKTNNTATFNADRDYPGYGFRLGYGYIERILVGTSLSFVLTEADGTKRKLAGASPNYNTSDGSGITLNSTTLNLLYKNGRSVAYQVSPSNDQIYRPVKITDTNGNFISIVYGSNPNQSDLQISTLTDTLGRVITFNYDPDNVQTPSYWLLKSVTQLLSDNSTKTWASFQWNTKVLVYAFSGLTAQDSPASNDAAHPLNILTKCTYPNGTSVTFNYGDWGIVNSIERRTSNGTLRNTVSFNYPSGTTSQTDTPTYTTRAVTDDQGNARVWNYAITKVNGKVSTSTVANPDGSSSVTTLYTDGSSSDGMVQSIVQKNSAGTALRTTNYTYINGLPNVITTTLNDTGQQSKNVETFDGNGNLTEKDEYDYGLILKRKTLYSYVTTSTYTTVSCHIMDLLSQVLVEDASGAVFGKTLYTYDGTTPITQAATQHNATTCDSSNNVRGNLTNVTRYYDIANNLTIVRNFTFDTLGNLLTADLDCCNKKQIQYSSTYQNAYPTQVITGTGTTRTSSAAYDFNTGNLSSSTDVDNALTASYSYDVMNRVYKVTQPNGVQVTTTFDDNSSAPWITEASNAASTPVIATHFDSLNRPDIAELRDVTTAVSRTETTYDGMGRVSMRSNPKLPAGAALNTQYTYDGLGRTIAITPPGNAGNSTVSYNGNATVITDPAGKTQRNFTDALGRLVQVDEPGWADGLPGKGTVQISGAERVCCSSQKSNAIYDTGRVSVTVNGHSNSAFYRQLSNSGSIAAALATNINADAGASVNASTFGALITLTARTANSGTNYTLSTSAATTNSAHFSGSSFSATPSGPNLTGARDPSGPDTASLITPMTTTYSYDVMDNLTGVSQAAMGPVGGQQLAGQTRAYVYDAIGRLTSATTPESGQIQLTYLDSGKIDTRTDSRNITTKYCYDGLNRLQKISYTNNCAAPDVTYAYGSTAGAFGQIASVTDSSGSSTFTYSPLGFMKRADKLINGAHYILNYNYDESGTGRLNYVQYPSGRKVTQKYDTIGRVWNVTDVPFNGTEASRLVINTFNSAQQPLTMTYGNSVSATYDYDPNRLQISRIRYDAPNASHLLDLAYNYSTSANNGQILGVTDGIDGTRSTAYTYDAWSRLKTATAGGGGTWSISWDYDRFGNRLNQNGGGFATQTTVDPLTNHVNSASYVYDAAGNLTNDTQHIYSFDQENRITTVDTTAAAYAYDASNLRVKKVAGGNTTLYVYSGTQVVAEYVNGSLSKEYEYAGSTLLATLDSTGNVVYQHPDHLSTRIETDGSTGTVTRSFGHYPFGDTWYETGSTSKWKFTSYEEDVESTNQYAINRYDSERLGRFMSTDPLSGNLSNPQSLNRYTYSLNDPIRLFDPLGLKCITNSSDGNVVDDGTPPPCDKLSGGETTYQVWSTLISGPEPSGPIHHVIPATERKDTANIGKFIKRIKDFANTKVSPNGPCKGTSVVVSESLSANFLIGGAINVTVGISTTGLTVSTTPITGQVGLPQAAWSGALGYQDIQATAGTLDLNFWKPDPRSWYSTKQPAKIGLTVPLSSNGRVTGMLVNTGFGGPILRTPITGDYTPNNPDGSLDYCFSWRNN